MESLRRLPDAERIAAVETLRAERGLPRFVVLADGDNEMPVDLDSPASVDAMLGAARGTEPHRLIEMFPSPQELAAFGPEGRFVSQMVVPFGRVAPERVGSERPVPDLRLAAQQSAALARSFAPGSEWLYVKLYCGTATADRVLLDLVAPLVAEAKAQGHADRWFFLRYADPRPHLRVRLHGEASRLLGETLPRLHHALRSWLADGRVHGVQLDTYEREVERYGGVEGVEIAESIFEADSEAVVASLEHLVGDSALDARWRLGLLGIDRLLDDLALDLDARLRVLAALRDSFGREHRLERQGKRLGERLRAERKSLEALRAGLVPVESPLAAAIPCVAARSMRLRPLAAELRSRAAAGRLGASIEELASSFVHMHANRILRSAARAHEAVLYDFLWHLDESRRASARARARSPAPSSL
jgi:thiopeptide-type bacteriocin biosynthesis protein